MGIARLQCTYRLPCTWYNAASQSGRPALHPHQLCDQRVQAVSQQLVAGCRRVRGIGHQRGIDGGAVGGDEAGAAVQVVPARRQPGDHSAGRAGQGCARRVQSGQGVVSVDATVSARRHPYIRPCNSCVVTPCSSPQGLVDQPLRPSVH